jgi:uncharacterized C2H2 Zn-finger protein
MDFNTPPYDSDLWFQPLEPTQASGFIDPSLKGPCSPRNDYHFSRNKQQKLFPQEPLTPFTEASGAPTFPEFLTAKELGVSALYSRSESHGRSVSPLSLRHSSNCTEATLLDDMMYDSTGLPSTPGDLTRLSPGIEYTSSYPDESRVLPTSLLGIADTGSISNTPPTHWVSYNSYNDLDHALNPALDGIGPQPLSGARPIHTNDPMGLGIDETAGHIFQTVQDAVSPSAYPDFPDGDMPGADDQQPTMTTPQRPRVKQVKNLGKRTQTQQMVGKERAKSATRAHSRLSTKTVSSTTPQIVRCGPCNKVFRNEGMLEKHRKAEHVRPFVCVFHFAGCDATFAAKNEWKRHVTSQHLCLTYYLCTHDNCAQGKPDSVVRRSVPLAKNGHAFNRKDLYTQHVRRTHVPPQHRKTTPREWEDKIKEMQNSALRSRCQLPRRMACPVADCDREFFGDNAWDDRMEHVVRHMDRNGPQDNDCVKFDPDNDTTLTDWAEQVEVIRRTPAGGWELCYPLNEKSARRGGRRGGARAKAKVNAKLSSKNKS